MDTPGYSKPDSDTYSERTDESVAREQLSTADHVIWVTDVESGTLRKDDIEFIRSLELKSPMLIVLSKADKIPFKEVENVRSHVLKSLSYIDVAVDAVIPFSAVETEEYPTDPIIKWIEEKNRAKHISTIPLHLKRLFFEYQKYYGAQLDYAKRRLGNVNKISLYVDTEDESAKRSINDIIAEARNQRMKFERLAKELKQVQTEFFALVKNIGDLAGFNFQEPNEIEMLSADSSDLRMLLYEYCSRKKIKISSIDEHILEAKLPHLNTGNSDKDVKTTKSKELVKDQIPKIFRFERHALQKMDSLTKELYLTILIAIAFEDKVLAPSEDIYLKTLIGRMLNVEYTKIISKLDLLPEILENAIKTIKYHKLSLWLFVDSLILCRIDNKITPQESTLLGHLADALNLSSGEAMDCISMAEAILSRDNKRLTDISPNFPVIPICDTYSIKWSSGKLSFKEDISRVKAKGKYYIADTVKLSGSHNLREIELEFGSNGRLLISGNSKITLHNTKFKFAKIDCSNNSELHLTNCVLENNSKIGLTKRASIRLNDCKVENSTINLQDANKIALQKVSFSNVKNKRALFIDGCNDITISHCSFKDFGFDKQDNKQEVTRAITLKNGIVVIEDCRFENCNSSGDGAAISISNCFFSIDKCEFIKCSSAKNGGAVVVYDTFTLKNPDDGSNVYSTCLESNFDNCNAGDSGGAFFAQTPLIFFGACSFNKCKSKNRGGGLAMLGENRERDFVRILQCRFTENGSKSGSGLWLEKYACSAENREFDVINSDFIKCSTNHNHRMNSLTPSHDCILQETNNFE